MPRVSEKGEITRLLIDSSKGDRNSLDALFPVVYDELKRLASSYLRRERADHTLQPTALVHEAYLKLIDQREVDWQNRAQFFGIAAQMMRRILLKHAEKHNAEKRGGNLQKVTLDEAIGFFEKQNLDIIELDKALSNLARFDERQANIVELRFFGGLKNEEVAEVIGISLATVKREWTIAKAWLLRELSQS
ncbi:MAG TPA: sigma-70 family RNA polymerase sigma factor [Pyrinomonadaceae bacterium]|nr:sigma-70 family RNA polymerase sigma factor [Pyrinomonadaceae bacterium]